MIELVDQPDVVPGSEDVDDHAGGDQGVAEPDGEAVDRRGHVGRDDVNFLQEERKAGDDEAEAHEREAGTGSKRGNFVRRRGNPWRRRRGVGWLARASRQLLAINLEKIFGRLQGLKPFAVGKRFMPELKLRPPRNLFQASCIHLALRSLSCVLTTIDDFSADYRCHWRALERATVEWRVARFAGRVGGAIGPIVIGGENRKVGGLSSAAILRSRPRTRAGPVVKSSTRRASESFPVSTSSVRPKASAVSKPSTPKGARSNSTSLLAG